MEEIYKKLLIILKIKFKGDHELITKFLKLIIIRLKKRQRITQEEIREAKSLYKKNEISFELLKEDNDIYDDKQDEIEEDNILNIKGNELNNRDEEKAKEILVANANANSNMNGNANYYYRIWGVILPLLYIGHYLYSNMK